jgi:hypothetical protein
LSPPTTVYRTRLSGRLCIARLQLPRTDDGRTLHRLMQYT